LFLRPNDIAVAATPPPVVAVPFLVTLLGGEAVEAAYKTRHYRFVLIEEAVTTAAKIVKPPDVPRRTPSLSSQQVNQKAQEKPMKVS